MLGPTGIGGLYVKSEILEQMEPFLTGGEMVQEVTFQSATWNDLPMRFEAGTPNIAGSIGLGAAVDYLEALGMDEVHQHETEITQYALEALKELAEEFTFYGPSTRPSAAASSPSPRPIFTPTTWEPSSTRRASPSAPAITAPCPWFETGWDWPPPPAPASTCTTQRMKSTCW